jgi:superfamily II DNA or RNA helicase
VSPWDVLPQVLTSVDFLKKETVSARAFRRRWDLIVVDEAHALAESGTPSNPYSTQRHRLGRRLREASTGLILLTATPHNGYVHSFRSLLELIEPAGASLHGDEEAIRRRIGRAMVRRMKSQIRRRLPDGSTEQVFPPRHVKGIPVALPNDEQELLGKVASYCSRTARAAAGGDDADLVSFAMQIVKKRSLSTRRALATTVSHRLEALRRESAREAPLPPAELRDLQAGLALEDAASERGAIRILRSAVPSDERRRKAEIRALASIHRDLQKLATPDAKIQALLVELRDVLRADAVEKVIVFTEYLDSLAALREGLDGDPELTGRYVVLRGGMSLRARRRAQEQFESDHVRVLLATDAAGEGLNLQHKCRRIIHLELPWNPNRLEQRNGRVDRYGQRRDPVIRYLFYPASPEEAVLDQLVDKIEAMAKSYVSTPDILGVLAGDGTFERGLLDLDPEAADRDAQVKSLVKAFEDRTAEFARDMKPLLEPGDGVSGDGQLVDQLAFAEPLLRDDSGLEKAVLERLGSRAIVEHEDSGVFRIDVPSRLRGAAVRPTYPAATFRRGVATRHRAEDVVYLTPLHPLVQAMAAEARRRLIQVYEGERGVTPRRLAARARRSDEPPAVLFTFLVRVMWETACIEERLIGIVVDASGDVLQDDGSALVFEDAESVGEVSVDAIRDRYGAVFPHLVERASAEALRRARLVGDECRRRRVRIAAELEKDLERDLADRLLEIELEEKRARGLIEPGTGQIALFAAEAGGPDGGSIEARRAAVEAAGEARQREIEAYKDVAEPLAPLLLGALFLIADGS